MCGRSSLTLVEGGGTDKLVEICTINAVGGVMLVGGALVGRELEEERRDVGGLILVGGALVDFGEL